MTAIMVDLRGSIPPNVLLQHAQGAFGYSGHNRVKCPPMDYGARLVAAGGLYAVVFEDSATRARAGYQAGRDDAVFANRDADQQGYPQDCAIWATADFDATPSEISPYVQGFHEGSKRPVGLYADGDCIREFKHRGWIVFGWLTCSGGFHGSGDLTGVDVKQRCAGESGQIGIPGYSIDTNYLLTPFIAAWGQTVASPAPKPSWEAPPFPGPLVEGDVSPAVSELKILLTLAGYGKGLDLAKSQVFGAGTAAEVKKAQADYYRNAKMKGTPDGKVGPRTWGWLCDIVKVKKAIKAGKH